MRLLLLALFAGCVVGAPGKKEPVDCIAVLDKFHQDRDACLTPLGLLEWTVFSTATSAPTAATDAPTNAPTAATDAPTEAPTAATDAPTEAPTATDAPTAAPTAAPTDAPTAAPTDAPTEAPTDATDAPTDAPTEAPTEAPTDTPAMEACASSGACRSFINGADMWRGQIEMCLREAARAEEELVAKQIASELAFATELVNKGCSKNVDGVLCADGPLAGLKAVASACPATQADVDGWIQTFDCCVASYAELSMTRARLMDEDPCPGEFRLGKACKAPKWKLPKKAAAKAGSAAKKGKIAAVTFGAVAGVGLIGLALRKRRAKLTSTAKTQKATEQVAMVSVPVAV